MKAHWFPVTLLVVITIVTTAELITAQQRQAEADKAFAAFRAAEKPDTVWRGWDKYQIPDYNDTGRLILYGRQLIENTAYYLGPKGRISQLANGMNCQNCHLDGGTMPFGNNFGKTYSTYPLYRPRNNGLQTIYMRIRDCFERSLNGIAPDSNGIEMRAMYAYMKWVADDVPRGVIRGGTGIMKLPYLDRAADPVAGASIYAVSCASCHGDHGQGIPNTANTGYTYPPLWGSDSYNDGAGLYRIGSLAGFVKCNMPFGATDYHDPKLTNEEAWDVAAFIDSRPRPHKDQSMDWKVVAQKPIDFPTGPYADSFSEIQHKFGPWKPIAAANKNNK